MLIASHYSPAELDMHGDRNDMQYFPTQSSKINGLIYVVLLFKRYLKADNLKLGGSMPYQTTEQVYGLLLAK